METMKYTRAEDELTLEDGQGAGGSIDPTPLLGAWLNTDKATRGIVKLIIRDDDNAFKVRAFGACVPSPCDWGEAEGHVFSAGVASREGMAFTVSFDFGFMETDLAVYMKGGILVLDSFNTFKDGSGRADYFSREFFHN
jgi:hypothetical protein